MINKIASTIILLMLSTTIVCSLPTAKITIRVIDESGEVVENAKVGAAIEKPKKKGIGSDSKNVRGLTDKNGMYTVSGSSEPHIGFSVTKDGYYKSIGRFKEFTGVTGFYGLRKWKPWNPTIDVVLKKIINPIPLFVAENIGKGITYDPPAILPEEGRDFGYDLIANDWVVPYGQGLHSDFIFKIIVDRYVDASDYDSTMFLNFTSPDDGIQPFYQHKIRGSKLRSSHNAPKDKYENVLKIRYLAEKNKIKNLPIKDNQNYYFRVRTKRDDKGNIVEALYGKIYGNIEFLMPRNEDKGEIYFSYYLNPNNNDTNIEFSPEKNLFPKPKRLRGKYSFKP
ncbi:carboxypeptidase-like regulatory domain-containing protein [uncultured Cocleimonas sp.]|uniref:carboxypeptidase-like regulatory domain-containing protein n=1 Tax=uncultured Cocleimonas sp. TaxID=1051587 RepID=UPI00261F5ECB|nr:carboxypeptidase-like regulatory domain-containing protein [uncultured Cocleimonas sp.]